MRRSPISSAVAEEEDINLTPMLDVVFILLIFFIVTANFIKEPGLEVNRPDAETSNIQENAANIIDNTKTGISVYGNYKLSEKFSVFGRYDNLDSENANGEQWNIEKDGTLQIFGIERKMAKGVTVAVNLQNWQDATEDNMPEADVESTLYLNLEYKF